MGNRSEDDDDDDDDVKPRWTFARRYSSESGVLERDEFLYITHTARVPRVLREMKAGRDGPWPDLATIRSSSRGKRLGENVLAEKGLNQRVRVFMIFVIGVVSRGVALPDFRAPLPIHVSPSIPPNHRPLRKLPPRIKGRNLGGKREKGEGSETRKRCAKRRR